MRKALEDNDRHRLAPWQIQAAMRLGQIAKVPGVHNLQLTVSNGSKELLIVGREPDGGCDEDTPDE